MGARDRLREHFLAHGGVVVDAETLRAVAGISEWARRVRELRDEEGYRILSHHDRADLKPGQYVLEDPKPQPRLDRGISSGLRAEILRRNGFTCQACGLTAGDPDPSNPSRHVRLQVDHVVPISEGGSETRENLRVLCSACNAGKSNLELPSGDVLNVLAIIRRAPRAVQREVYGFLRAKFEEEDQG